MSNSKIAFTNGKPFYIMYPINDEQTKKLSQKEELFC